MTSREPIPPARSESLRQQLLTLLQEGVPRSAKDISGFLGISEKEVVSHLSHVHRSLGQSQKQLVVEPSGCRHCGFVFGKRDRLTKPGKCPKCRGTSITEPLFYIA